MARGKTIDVDFIYRRALEGYNHMTAPRDPSDFGGHEYAYRCGYAKETFRQILKELGVEIVEDEEGEKND